MPASGLGSRLGLGRPGTRQQKLTSARTLTCGMAHVHGRQSNHALRRSAREHSCTRLSSHPHPLLITYLLLTTCLLHRKWTAQVCSATLCAVGSQGILDKTEKEQVRRGLAMVRN